MVYIKTSAAIVATVLAASVLAAPPQAPKNNRLEASKARLQKDIGAIDTVEKFRQVWSMCWSWFADDSQW